METPDVGTADDYAWWSAAELSRLIATGDLSAVEVVEAALTRIERVDGDLHSFLTVMAEHARVQASAADRAQRRGERLGPLHGVPVSLKDEVWTAGVRSTFGSLLYADFVPDTDSESVRRLRAAGAIVVG